MNADLLKKHVNHIRSGDMPQGLTEEERTRLLVAYEKLGAQVEKLISNPSSGMPTSAGSIGLKTSLHGCGVGTVSVSQFFRLTDFVLNPEYLKAEKLKNVITSVGSLRRALNPGQNLLVTDLGNFKAVANIGTTRDSFWSVAVPDLRNSATEEAPPLVMIPFEISPLPQVEAMHLALERRAEEIVHGILGVSSQPSSVRGALRIYPTGIGVVRLSADFNSANALELETMAEIARAIEDALFIKPDGFKSRVESVLAKIVDLAAKSLFVDAGEHDRRWRPPETTFRFQLSGTRLDELSEEFAFLMSLSPGNRETLRELRQRVDRKLASRSCRECGVLAVPGARVLLVASELSKKTNQNQRASRLMRNLVETHELTSAALHTYKVFVEDLVDLKRKGVPSDDWLPNTLKYPRLVQHLVATRRALEATACIPDHLQRTGAGVLRVLAGELWAANIGQLPDSVTGVARHLLEWIHESGHLKERSAKPLLDTLEAILRISPPFGSVSPDPKIDLGTDEQEQLEAELLARLRSIDKLLAADSPDLQELDREVLLLYRARQKLFGSEDLVAPEEETVT